MTQPDQNEKDPNAPYLTRPTTQTDLEARHEADYGNPTVQTDPNLTNAPYAVEDNDTSAYVGVDPDRMTYANETEKPLRSDDSLEDEVSKEMLSGYAFGRDEEPEGQQTLGSGSSSPVVAVTTSGEATTHAIVDRKALGKQIEKNDAAAREGKNVEPLRSTEKFVTREEGSSLREEEDVEPTSPASNPRPAKAPTPKAKQDDDNK